MRNKTKTVFWDFIPPDYKAMEEYLEEMAKKGWMLVKVGEVTARFKKIEPKEIKFYVDIFQGGGPLTPNNTIEAKSYRSRRERLGWNHITSQNHLQFFYANENEDTYVTEKDEMTNQESIVNTLWKQELLNNIIIFIALYIFTSTLLTVKYTVLLDYTGIASLFIFPLLAINIVFRAIYGIVWVIKAKRNIKNNLSIKKPTLKGAKRRALLFNKSSFIIFSVFMLTAIIDGVLTSSSILISALIPISGISLGVFIRHFVKKKVKSKESAILYAIVGIIAGVIIIQSIAVFFITRGRSNTISKEDIPEDYPLVTMDELITDSENINLINRRIEPSTSPIVPQHYYYTENWDVNNTRKRMVGNYYKSIHPYFTEIIFKGKLEERLKWIDTTLAKNEEMEDLWNVDKFYISENNDAILIQKNNIVMYLSGDINFLEPGVKEKIIDTLTRTVYTNQ